MSVRLATLLLAAACALPAPAEEPAKAPDGMALIPAGEFTMGRTKTTQDDEVGMRPKILRDDRPAHQVYLDSYYLDKTEVSQSQYAEFVAATGHRTPYHWLGGEMPKGEGDIAVHNVDFTDANAYCAWQGKRLPTEAEWERAARGGLEGKDYPWGDGKATSQLARYATPAGPGKVGQFPPNEFGLHDMAGNITEWCSDYFERTYYETSPAKNPKGPETGMYRIVRGGSWSSGPRRITTFFRNWVRPNQRTPNLGIRCAMDSR